MNEWGLTIGLAIVCLGIVKSVHEEWAKSGLTDTSYTSLLLWILGLVVVMAWGVTVGMWWLLVMVAPVGLFCYWIVRKVIDKWQAFRHGHRRWDQLHKFFKRK